jgi:hypothetical protein
MSPACSYLDRHPFYGKPRQRWEEGEGNLSHCIHNIYFNKNLSGFMCDEAVLAVLFLSIDGGDPECGKLLSAKKSR